MGRMYTWQMVAIAGHFDADFARLRERLSHRIDSADTFVLRMVTNHLRHRRVMVPLCAVNNAG